MHRPYCMCLRCQRNFEISGGDYFEIFPLGSNTVQQQSCVLYFLLGSNTSDMTCDV
jgi:hypothetical protein